MKAIVFGGNGYIGRYLQQLTRSFDEIVLADVHPADDVVLADVRDPIRPDIAGEGAPDWIVLLAAVHREPGHSPSEYFETNLAGARNVAVYADAVGCKNIFFFSSSSVYGPTEKPTDEQAPTVPNSPYGSSKLGAELIFEGWLEGGEGRRLVICRPGVVYGPHDPGNVLRMIRAIDRGVFVLPGDRDVRKSYGYVYGLIDGFDFAVAHDERLIRFNYVERDTETLGTLVSAIKDELGTHTPVPSVPTPIVVAGAYAVQAVTGGRSPLHPTRVRKAAQPTHVVPQWLIDQGFEFKFDFRSSLAHWATIAPEDFGRGAVQPRRTSGRRFERIVLPTETLSVHANGNVPELELVRKRFRRVAIVHDWLTVPGGSEQVLMSLLNLFPEAEIFTSVYDPAPWPRTITGRVIHESFVGRVPHASRIYPRLLPFMRRAFRSFDLSGYDLVVSSSHAFAKSVVATGQPHVCYCHTPLRLLWEPRFLSREAIGPAARAGLVLADGHLKRIDREDAKRLNTIMANSTYTAERIRRYWGRNATVVHPPVDIERFATLERRPGSAYVVLGRVVPYKRADLAVAACAELGRPVIVVGEGRALAGVRAVAGPHATFLGRVSDEAVAGVLAEARAVICCADEDFGIVPVEAQAAGVPVIAYGTGGHRDTVTDGRHGVLFHEQTVEAVVAAIERFETMTFDPDELRRNASRFATERFNREVIAAIASLVTPPGRR